MVFMLFPGDRTEHLAGSDQNRTESKKQKSKYFLLKPDRTNQIISFRFRCKRPKFLKPKISVNQAVQFNNLISYIKKEYHLTQAPLEILN